MTDSAINTGSGGDHGEALAALERLESEIAGVSATDSLDRDQVCEQYRRIKPLLNTAITLVQAIPVYGPRIAAAIRFLMGIADRVCDA
jgi:hypothetical protein